MLQRNHDLLLIPDKGNSHSSNNFDLIRICMAMLVVWSHSFAIYSGSESDEPLSLLTKGAMNSGNFGVLVFFIVSGLLITKSFDRSKSPWTFLWKRIKRIHPAFIVSTSVCAFVVLPLYSHSNFSVFSPAIIAEIIGLNLLLQGYFAGQAPFSGNPIQALNGSLWSISFEFWCYFGVLALGIFGFLKPRFRLLLLFVFFLLALVHIWLELTGRKPGGGILGMIFGWPYIWFRVLPCFISGMLAYQYRDWLRRSLLIAVTGPLLVIASTNLPISIAWKSAILAISFPTAIAYSVFFFAFAKQLFNAGKFGDFSYGAYLYAFPIQQMLRADLGTRIPFGLYVFLSMILSLAAGIASWYCIERWFEASRVKDQQAVSMEASAEHGTP